MNIAIIGAGPAGVMAGIEALKNSDIEVTFFDKNDPLLTLLPTGGGRCNLAYAEFDNAELVKFYPRGEKFLLSVFSRFSTGDTMDFFDKIGVSTYIQDDMRVFPVSNSSADVRRKLLRKFEKRTHFLKENVVRLEKLGEKYKIFTDNADYLFDKVIFAGGIKSNFDILKKLGIVLVEPRPALCSLCVTEKNLYSLSGVSFQDITASIYTKDKFFKEISGDLLITHKSLSGPLSYKISAYTAYENFPWKIKLNFVNENFEDFDKKFIELLNNNSKKDIINVVADFVPRSFAQYLLEREKIQPETKSFSVNKDIRVKISKNLTEFEITVSSQKKDGEIVTAGGVDLNFVNSKTMQYKDFEGLYFCGEVLDVDGLTGGFNLQNCWSTGYLAGHSLLE